MSFTPNFSAGQAIGLPSQIVFTDTSTGTDGNIASRRIYLQQVGGTYLVPTGTSTDYIAWAYNLVTKTVDVLNDDYSLLITVQWLDSGDAVLYSKTVLYEFSLYGQNFQYQLTQDMISAVNILQDISYYKSKGELIMQLDSAAQAVEYLGNQTYSQQCLDIATNMRLNQKYFF